MGFVRSLNHVSISTADLDRSLHFYVDILGLELLGRGETDAGHLREITGYPDARIRWAELSIGGRDLPEIFEYRKPMLSPGRLKPAQAGSSHLALEVVEIDRLSADLAGNPDVTLVSAPVVIKEGNWSGAKACYLIDPDGINLELVQNPPAL